MAGMGAPPKPAGTRARRNAAPATTMLPAKGRGNKKAPPWPLSPDATVLRTKLAADNVVERVRAQLNATTDRRKIGRLERELDKAIAVSDASEQVMREQAEQEQQLWAEVWSTPQAAMWEKLAWSREVAQYVRWKIRAELGDLDAAKEARQWSDRLGLNPLALLRLRWEIERTDEATTRGERRRQGTKPAGGKPSAEAAEDDPRLRLVR